MKIEEKLKSRELKALLDENTKQSKLKSAYKQAEICKSV